MPTLENGVPLALATARSIPILILIAVAWLAVLIARGARRPTSARYGQNILIGSLFALVLGIVSLAVGSQPMNGASSDALPMTVLWITVGLWLSAFLFVAVIAYLPLGLITIWVVRKRATPTPSKLPIQE